jgi:hypothetical protein
MRVAVIGSTGGWHAERLVRALAPAGLDTDRLAELRERGVI